MLNVDRLLTFIESVPKAEIIRNNAIKTLVSNLTSDSQRLSDVYKLFNTSDIEGLVSCLKFINKNKLTERNYNQIVITEILKELNTK